MNLIQENKGTPDPALVGRIVDTNPPPAAAVEGAVDVVAFVGVLQGSLRAPTTTPPGND